MSGYAFIFAVFCAVFCAFLVRGVWLSAAGQLDITTAREALPDILVGSAVLTLLGMPLILVVWQIWLAPLP